MSEQKACYQLSYDEMQALRLQVARAADLLDTLMGDGGFAHLIAPDILPDAMARFDGIVRAHRFLRDTTPAASVEAVGKPTDAMIRAACFAEAHRRILNWGVAKAAECSEHQRDEIAESFKETARTMLTAALGAAPSPRQRWKDPEASVEAVGRRWADSLEVAKAREAVMEGVTRIARGRAAITTGLADNRSTLLDALCNAVAACYTPKPEKTDAP